MLVKEELLKELILLLLRSLEKEEHRYLERKKNSVLANSGPFSLPHLPSALPQPEAPEGHGSPALVGWGWRDGYAGFTSGY
jgi:hypothetical protein